MSSNNQMEDLGTLQVEIRRLDNRIDAIYLAAILFGFVVIALALLVLVPRIAS